MGVQNDILSLIYLINKEARVTVKTPVGGTDAILLTNLVEQGTVLGSVPNNCSLNEMSTHSTGYNFGSVQIKPTEFVDDIADPSREKPSAIASNSVLEAIQHEKRIFFSAEKCFGLKSCCVTNFQPYPPESYPNNSPSLLKQCWNRFSLFHLVAALL